MSQQARAEITRILSERFEIPAEKLANDATPFTDLGLDSLDFVDLLIEIEKVLGRSIDFKDLKEIQTVGQFIQKIESTNPSGTP